MDNKSLFQLDENDELIDPEAVVPEESTNKSIVPTVDEETVRKDKYFPALDRAIDLATKKHINQPYRGKSYVEGHIIPVLTKVGEFTSLPYVQVAAVLHDIVEDTDVHLSYIKKEFGEGVADLVWRVTDEPGLTRLERKLKTYQKIRASMYATLIKLCDRYVNTDGSTKLDMYRKEFPAFKQALWRPGQWDSLWKDLERITNKQ